jgi:hypothetical protein
MMTAVHPQDVGQMQAQVKRQKWLIAALAATMALAVVSLVALVVVAVTDEETVVTQTETVTNTRVVPLRTPTPGEITTARSMKDEMSIAVGRTVQVADPQTGLTPGQLADSLRWQAKAEAFGIKPQQTGGLTFEGLKGDSKDDLPGSP